MTELSSTEPYSLAVLVERHRAFTANLENRSAFTLRMHRSLSWMQRADAAGNDDDIAFICLWIAFNAAYAQDVGNGVDSAPERQTFREFVGQVCTLDSHKTITNLVWKVFSGPIRVLLDNKYVFQPFWDAQADGSRAASLVWREAFDAARQHVHRALAQQDTERVLYEVFVRLYTLRNQLMHGGATWNSSINRAQVRDGRALLRQLLPVILDVMMTYPKNFHGRPSYPVVSD